jgi:hypothetical protein
VILGHTLAGVIYLAVAAACFGIILFGPGRRDRALRGEDEPAAQGTIAPV